MRTIRKRLLALLLTVAMLGTLFAGLPIASAASEALGNVTDAAVDGNTLLLTIDSGGSASDLLTLEVCQDNILRVDYQPESVEPSPDTPIIDPELTWDTTTATEIDITGDPIVIQTDGMRIEISRTPCRMTVMQADGTTLFWEPESGGIYHDGVRFVRAESSNMYGIHGFDCFSDNGNLLRNDNSSTAAAGQQGNSGGPFMWSTAGYGILVDSDGGYPYTNSTDRKMEFYYGGTPAEGRRYEKEDVEYFIMLGEPKEIMAGFSKITGTSPMMPKWSLGFSNFEWDIDEDEFYEMVELYRAKNIPIDGYAFDYDWKRYGDDNYGEFTWNTDNFPSAASTQLKEDMESKGIKMIGITKPRVVTKLSDGTPTEQGVDAEAGDYFYPGHYEYTDYFLPVTVRSIDPYKAAERNWWWLHSQDAFDRGIVGWWNDETDKVSSNGADYWFGNFTTAFISQAMYEGQREYTDDSVRVWQTARNYYPGTQRYATSIWSGDVATQFYKGERVSWAAGLNEQKAAMLSTINNGQPKWGSDGGGFNQNSGNIENPSPELYTRWLQFASMSPVFRVHGTNHQQRQPWYFGTTAEEVTKSAIQQRYSLIPYMYSYEREAYDSGLGLVYPLLFDYPDDENVADYASLFGASTDTQASVNQNHSGYSGAGFVDKLEAAGAGVTFYAKVANAGDYDVTFRYANGDAAERSLSVYVNGSYIGKTIMPSTGHWDTWADCLMQLPLAAGNNIITLKHEDASGDTGYVNLDSCTVPFYPEVITAEAENAALYGTAGTNQDHWNYSGSGFVDGMTSAGAGAEFEITVPKDGSYEASIRYCNGTQATEDLNLYVNGSYIETISFGSIGGNWNEWQELTQTLELDEGRNVVALRYDSSNSGNVNLDKLSVKTEPDATISVPLVDNGGFERDTSQSSAWTEWHPDGQAVAYGVDSGSGTNPPESPYAGDKRVYFYSSSAYQQSIHQGINLPNGTYTVQAWIKVSNTAPDIGRMEATGYGGDSIYVDMPYAGTGWRLVETDITVTTGYLDIGLYCSSLGGTTVHIDNVKILNK